MPFQGQHIWQAIYYRAFKYLESFVIGTTKIDDEIPQRLSSNATKRQESPGRWYLREFMSLENGAVDNIEVATKGDSTGQRMVWGALRVILWGQRVQDFWQCANNINLHACNSGTTCWNRICVSISLLPLLIIILIIFIMIEYLRRKSIVCKCIRRLDNDESIQEISRGSVPNDDSCGLPSAGVKLIMYRMSSSYNMYVCISMHTHEWKELISEQYIYNYKHYIMCIYLCICMLSSITCRVCTILAATTVNIYNGNSINMFSILCSVLNLHVCKHGI